MIPPTFDEWFREKNFASFEDLYLQDYMTYDAAWRALMRAMRDYVTEFVRDAAARGE